MSMVKPIALNKNAFDASNSEKFSFTSIGGNQVVKNKITIRLNSDNSIVYTNTQETFEFGQTVPANTLINGEYYNFFFNTYDINDNESPDSNIVSFYCYETPTLTFLNVNNGATIESSNFNFIVQYNQGEGELLDNLKMILYDINGSVLADSGVLYILEAPPAQTSYIFNGMNNNTNYRIKAEGVTVNGTRVESDLITFEIRFENPSVYTKIDLENKCDDGYVQFRSNLVFIDAASNPNPPEYINATVVDLSDLTHWVEWMQGYEIPRNFVMELWMKPALLGEFCLMWNGSNLSNYLQLSLQRKHYGTNELPEDNFEVYGISGNEYVKTFSNIVPMVNNLTKMIVWIKKDENDWELKLDVVETICNTLQWNDEFYDKKEDMESPSNCNVEYNKLTNMVWNNETVPYVKYSPNSDGTDMTDFEEENSEYFGCTDVPIELFESPSNEAEVWVEDKTKYTWTKLDKTFAYDGEPNGEPYESDGVGTEEPERDYNLNPTEHIGNIDSLFPVTNTKIRNGIYYHASITRDTSLNYSRNILDWSYYTIIDCTFNNTLNGGNTNILLSQLQGLAIKRRKIGTFQWITLKELDVLSPDDLNVVYQDSFVPSSSEFQYALVPIFNGNIEGEYVVNQIKTNFNGVFISDRDTIFKLYNSVMYGGTTAHRVSGMIQPIGSRYPTFVTNSIIDYKEGQISALLLGYGFEKNRKIDRLDVINQTEDLISFLNNDDAKIITDWNGNIVLVRINPSPTISYNGAYGNGIDTVSFNWTEQGKYDDQVDLYENGLIDTLG